MLSLSVSLLVLLCVTNSLAYSGFRGTIPNGEHVPHPCKPNYLWHGVGHENPLGGGVRNAFGLDFNNNGNQWTSTLCRLDSDGDGLTNGQELGDPDCVWTPNTVPARTTDITHPGVCEPFDSVECRARNDWVSCDTGEFDCPPKEESHVKNITLRYPTTAVPSTETNYFCMTFDLPNDDAYHIVATEPYLDNAQVMHHILLFGCDNPDQAPVTDTPQPCGMATGGGCNSIIGGWTVGSAGQCMHTNAGVLIGTGGFRRARLQFHWNNPERRADYTDSSGLTLHYTPQLRPYNTATLTIGQRIFEIPPAQPSVVITGSCTSECSRMIMQQPIYVQGVLNHMHYLGRSQKVEVFRNGNLQTVLAQDDQYSYDSPVRHRFDTPYQLMPGDELRTTCEFSSSYKTKTVFYGDGTSDEMCFSFLDVYPAEALPWTKFCLGVRSHSSCDMFRQQYGQCDLRKFTNASHPETRRIMGQLEENCDTFGSCRPECHALMTEISDHPCLQGDAYFFLKDTLTKTHEGTLIMAMLESCRDRLQGPGDQQQCPECQPCNDAATGTAATLRATEVVTLATVSVFALFMKCLW